MKTAGLFKGIKKNVVVLGMVSFFTDVSSEMIYPVIPIFLTATLGAPVSIVGLIEGVAESTASILKAFSGWLSDLLERRRPFIVIGYTLSSFAKPLLFLAGIWQVVLISRFLDRVGKGLRTSARDAMIADVTEPDYRGKAFGFHRAMDTFGACTGPLAAILLLSMFRENLRIIFLIAFVPALVAVLLLVFLLKEARSSPRRSQIPGFGKVLKLDPALERFFIASAIFAIGNSSDAFLILRSKDLGLSTTMVILAYVLYNISYSLFSTPLGALSDRVGRKNIMIIGYVIFAVIYAGFGMVTSSKAVWILFPVYGLYIAMTDGVGKALVSDMSRKDERGTVLGLYHFILGIFAFFASLVAGLLWTHIGVQAPFLYGAATAVISCIALAVFV